MIYQQIIGKTLFDHTMSMRPNPSEDGNSNQVLPRSLYVPQRDPRANLREMVDSVFSDKFMIFLSLILIPLILIPFIFELDATDS